MNRAEKAQATLDHEFIQEAFSTLTANCHDVISQSAHDQQDLREDMYYMLRAIKCLRGVFLTHVRTGKMEDLKKMEIKRIKR